MANETTATTLDDTVYSAIITSELLRELRPANVMRPLLRWGPAGNSKVYQFPILDKPALPAALTEGSDLGLPGSGNTAITTSQAQVTAGQIAQKATVTRFVERISLINAFEEVRGVLMRGVYEKFETDAAALLDGFSTVTTAASTMTVDDWLLAMSALEQRDVTSPLVGVLHPKQVGELRADVVSNGGEFFSTGANADIAKGVHQNGEVGSLFGVTIYQTSLVASAGGDRHGAMFAVREALGGYEIWGPTAEVDPDPSQLGSEIVVSQCYGVGEISDTRGQEIASDA